MAGENAGNAVVFEEIHNLSAVRHVPIGFFLVRMAGEQWPVHYDETFRAFFLDLLEGALQFCPGLRLGFCSPVASQPGSVEAMEESTLVNERFEKN